MKFSVKNTQINLDLITKDPKSSGFVLPKLYSIKIVFC